jgi:hypothetical protein
VLVANGADVDAKNRRGAEPLHMPPTAYQARTPGTPQLKPQRLPVSSRPVLILTPLTKAVRRRCTVPFARGARKPCERYSTVARTHDSRTAAEPVPHSWRPDEWTWGIRFCRSEGPAAADCRAAATSPGGESHVTACQDRLSSVPLLSKSH